MRHKIIGGMMFTPGRPSGRKLTQIIIEANLLEGDMESRVKYVWKELFGEEMPPSPQSNSHSKTNTPEKENSEEDIS